MPPASFQALGSLKSALGHDGDVLNAFQLGLLEAGVVKTLTCIRSRRNQFCTAAQLPSEILTHIFRLATARPAGTLEAVPDMHTLLALSQVCARWRAVAISDKRAWADIAITKVGALEDLFLQRSGDMRVRVVVPADLPPAVVHRTFYSNPTPAICPRIDHLVFPIQKVFYSQHLRGFLTAFISSLTRLSIVSPLVDGRRFEQNALTNAEPIEWFTTTPSDPSPCAPKLRVLSISLLALTLPKHPLPSLVHLRLTGDHSCGVSPNHLLAFLEGTPQLQTLYAFDVRPSDLSWPGHPSTTVVHLHYLRALYLDTFTLPELTTILSRLAIPQTALVQLHRVAPRFGRSGLDDLTRLLAALPNLGDCTSIDVAEHHTDLHVRAWSPPAFASRGALWLHLTGPGFGVPRASMVRCAVAMIARRTVRTLRVAADSSAFQQNLLQNVIRAVSPAAPAISTLVLASYNAERRLGAHVRAALVPSEEEEEEETLPALEHLTVQVSFPILDSGVLIDTVGWRARTGLKRVTLSAPGAVALDSEGDEGELVLALERVGKAVAVEFVAERLWAIEEEGLWRGQGMNEYWMMYPGEDDREAAWGLPRLSWPTAVSEESESDGVEGGEQRTSENINEAEY
ncbi:hypothetical protein C8Q76DRAFT_792715 [Earliella scabrosa]|nr:hypothetical protein C8Q76DRAFT_792715 [Earliella scabrosa]